MNKERETELKKLITETLTTSASGYPYNLQIYGIDELVKKIDELYEGQNVRNIVPFYEIRRIWDAAEKHVMHETGEICRDDAAYEEDALDLEAFYERYY